MDNKNLNKDCIKEAQITGENTAGTIRKEIIMKKRNIFKECQETIQEIGKANGKEGKAALVKQALGIA